MLLHLSLSRQSLVCVSLVVHRNGNTQSIVFDHGIQWVERQGKGGSLNRQHRQY